MKKVFLGLTLVTTMMSFTNVNAEANRTNTIISVDGSITQFSEGPQWCEVRLYRDGRLVGYGAAPTCQRALEIAMGDA